MATDQYKIRLSLGIIEKLREAADRFGMKSGNEVAAEIIERYLEFWVATKEAQESMFEQQRAAISAEKSAMASSPKSKPSRRKK